MSLFGDHKQYRPTVAADLHSSDDPDLPADEIPVDEEEAEESATRYTCSLLERYLAKAMDGDKTSAQIACSIIEKAILGQDGYFLTPGVKKVLGVAFREAAGAAHSTKRLGCWGGHVDATHTTA
ncbi:hypothetical protein [Thiolapillus sp.]|uniref:hypothetical protein n=1 Tax=Thiolapillus sp. TaxID=2017437 RepID=UPI003AF5948E